MQLESTKNKKLKIKFWLYCIYFLLLAGLTHTQTTTWQKIFNGPFPTLNDYGYASCRADGDNIYVLGSIQNARIYLLKLNSMGDTIWTKVIGNDFSRGNAIVESDSGSCVLTGEIENRQAFSIKVDKNGTVLWQKYYGGNFTQLYDIEKTLDNGFILCGNDNYLDAIIIKIDSFGNLQWKKTFSSNFVMNFYSLINLDSTGYILTGYRSEISTQPSNGLIMTVDLSGTLIWDTLFTFNIGSTAGKKIIKNSNGYLVCGSIRGNKLFNMMIDNYGRIEYSNIFDSTNDKFDIGEIKMVSSNKFIMNYSEDSGSVINGKILMFDTLGNVLKTKTYSTLKQITFGSIIQLRDTGFIFCGTIDNNLSSRRDIYVIKSDTLFNSIPPIGINSHNYTIPELIYFKSYPNPFNPSTTIQFGLNKKANVNLLLYDITGNLVDELINKSLGPGNFESNWNPNKLSSSIYFACFYINGILSKTIKLMFIK